MNAQSGKRFSQLLLDIGKNSPTIYPNAGLLRRTARNCYPTLRPDLETGKEAYENSAPSRGRGRPEAARE